LKERKARDVADVQRERERLWPQGSAPERSMNSCNEYFKDVASDVLPRVICAICGEIHAEQAIELVGKVSVTDKLIRSNFRFLCLGVALPDVHGHLEPADSLKGLPLDGVGIRDDGTMQVCRTCKSSLVKCDMPRRAIANGLDFGEVPHQLRDMSICEQALVSRVRFKVNILKLLYEPIEGKSSEAKKRKTPPQRGIKGHAIGFPQVGVVCLVVQLTFVVFQNVGYLHYF